MPRWTVRLPDAISNLVNGAPAALDTLNELAIALQDNDSEIASLVTSVSRSWLKVRTCQILPMLRWLGPVSVWTIWRSKTPVPVAITGGTINGVTWTGAASEMAGIQLRRSASPGLYRRISRKGSSPSIRLMASSMPMCRGRWLSLVVCRLLRMRRPMAGQYVRQDNGWQPAAAGGGDWTLLATGNFPAGNAEYVFPVTFTVSTVCTR